MQLKKKHEKDLLEQKEEYGKLLREENSKWKLQREELENEILKLRKTPTKTTASLKSQDADLTAFIKDLKESADHLSTSKTNGKRSSTTAVNNTTPSNNRYISNVRSITWYFLS